MKYIVLLLTLGGVLAGVSVAQAAPITFAAHLNGMSEATANSSPGMGDAVIIFDPELHSLLVEVTFSGLLGLTTVAHIHCCTASPGAGNAGVATEVPSFNSFPVSVSSGSYVHLFDLTQASALNPAFVAANGGLAQAELALLSGSFATAAYLNIHSSQFPAGEIRGFLTPVPEPGNIVLLGLGLALIGVCRRKLS